MVLNITLLHTHKRSREIFGCSEELAFVGKGVVAAADFLQLLPVRASPVYTPYNS